MGALDELLKRVTKRTTTIVIEEQLTEEDDKVNTVAKEVVQRELSELDTRVAMLEQQLELLRRD